MYRVEDWNYFARPFGITGQPSVNSVLLVFFYTLLLSRTSFKKSYIIFLLMIIGVMVQGSGSGFLALLMLFFAMIKKQSFFLLVATSIFGIFTVGIAIERYEFLEKISLFYITAMIEVFAHQWFEWLALVRSNFPIMSTLFGGISSEIDFGPLFFFSNVGIIYFVIFMCLIILAVFMTQSSYERWAIYILLVGNLHYPVMFYALMVFILPLYLHQVLFKKRKFINEKTSIN